MYGTIHNPVFYVYLRSPSLFFFFPPMCKRTWHYFLKPSGIHYKGGRARGGSTVWDHMQTHMFHFSLPFLRSICKLPRWTGFCCNRQVLLRPGLSQPPKHRHSAPLISVGLQRGTRTHKYVRHIHALSQPVRKGLPRTDIFLFHNFNYNEKFFVFYFLKPWYTRRWK